MKNLQIIVAGPAASGKSTMILWLEQVLMEAGFSIELQLENELLDYGTEERFRRTMTENFTKREENLIKNTKIVLTQMQTNRGSWKED